jgi:hypothetical protein
VGHGTFGSYHKSKCISKPGWTSVSLLTPLARLTTLYPAEHVIFRERNLQLELRVSRESEGLDFDRLLQPPSPPSSSSHHDSPHTRHRIRTSPPRKHITAKHDMI